MELTELKNRIIAAFKGAKEDLEKVLSIVEKDQSVFPFNEYERLICNLIEKGGLTYEQYIEIEWSILMKTQTYGSMKFLHQAVLG